jgi:hypothetical protein
MGTLYYVNAGASWFGFYLDKGALARQTMAPDSIRLVQSWPGPASTISSSLPDASRRDQRASRPRCVGTEVEYDRS